MNDIDVKNLSDILAESQVFYQRVRATVLSVSSRAKQSDFTKEQLADVSFLMREIIGQFEEIRKDVDANKGLSDRLFCLMVLQKTLMTPQSDDCVRTELTTAKPHYTKSVTLPKKDSEDYEKCNEYFGITGDGAEMGIAKISWKSVCKHVTELAELGKPIPEFLPKVFDNYAVIHRRK
jgi:hypothetical protein